jgi:hypothetical protein
MDASRVVAFDRRAEENSSIKTTFIVYPLSSIRH